MIDKQIIIDGVDVSGCSCHYNGWSQLYRDNRDMCDKGYDLECKPKENDCYHYTKCLEEQLKRKEQEYEELRQYHNKCCEENAKKEAEWLEKFNQISIGFYNGDYCNTEHCSLLKAKEQECEELKDKLNKIEEHLETISGIAPVTTRVLKHSIKTIIEE